MHLVFSLITGVAAVVAVLWMVRHGDMFKSKEAHILYPYYIIGVCGMAIICTLTNIREIVTLVSS